MSTHAAEVNSGARFEFGANWSRFLATVDDQRIAIAEQSLRDMLGDIRGKRFLDAGSGSGLFSLAAHRLGAIVHSFDYDPQSVACTKELRRRYAGNASTWRIDEGSVLDADYLARLGTFDIVYSWGVLHHTGDLWKALENVAPLASDQLFVAIYNDQGWKSRYWLWVKRLYNRSMLDRFFLHLTHMPVFIIAPIVYRALTGRLREASKQRGMNRWYDYLDWMGGYPYEVASVEALLAYFEPRGFSAQKVLPVSTPGCNQIVFRR